MTTHDTLLPCPFCGGGAELIDNAYNCVGWNTNYYSAYARCTECGAEGRHIKLTECYGPPDGTVDDAIAAWNRRADADGRRMSEPTTNDIEPTTSASDELRRLLDERGVEWGNIRNDGSESDYLTEWQFENNQGKATAIEWAVGSGLSVEIHRYHLTPEQAIAATLGPRITGETSDGYHTFNELYHHRAVLFSVIVRDHREQAWKSKLHHDGTMYDGMFIVGIETPNGQATYHYDVDPYWDMFECEELERAPEWDGHSPDDAIERISKLGTRECSYEIAAFGDGKAWFQCSECGGMVSAEYDPPKYCPHCGRKVKED